MAEEKEGQREEEEEQGRRQERRLATGRAAEAPLSGDDRSDEHHPGDRADVSERGPESGQTPVPLGGPRAPASSRCRTGERAGTRGSRPRTPRAGAGGRSTGASAARAIGSRSAVAATHASVSPMTHGLRRRETSDRAPSSGRRRARRPTPRSSRARGPWPRRPARRRSTPESRASRCSSRRSCWRSRRAPSSRARARAPVADDELPGGRDLDSCGSGVRFRPYSTGYCQTTRLTPDLHCTRDPESRTMLARVFAVLLLAAPLAAAEPREGHPRPRRRADRGRLRGQADHTTA